MEGRWESIASDKFPNDAGPES